VLVDKLGRQFTILAIAHPTFSIGDGRVCAAVQHSAQVWRIPLLWRFPDRTAAPLQPTAREQPALDLSKLEGPTRYKKLSLQIRHGMQDQKPNSATYNFDEVSGHNLESYQTLGKGGIVFYQVFLLSLLQCTVTEQDKL